jgi:hypothetical protein
MLVILIHGSPNFLCSWIIYKGKILFWGENLQVFLILLTFHYNEQIFIFISIMIVRVDTIYNNSQYCHNQTGQSADWFNYTRGITNWTGRLESWYNQSWFNCFFYLNKTFFNTFIYLFIISYPIQSWLNHDLEVSLLWSLVQFRITLMITDIVCIVHLIKRTLLFCLEWLRWHQFDPLKIRHQQFNNRMKKRAGSCMMYAVWLSQVDRLFAWFELATWLPSDNAKTLLLCSVR